MKFQNEVKNVEQMATQASKNLSHKFSSFFIIHLCKTIYDEKAEPNVIFLLIILMLPVLLFL